jgi:glutamate dehydrogenase
MLANTLVNEVGASFVYRIRSETQATYLQIVHCYFIAREIFHHDSICLAIRALPRELDRSVQYELTIQLARILYRATRWCLNHKNIQQVVVNGLELFKESVNDMRQLIAQQADQLYAESPLSKFFIKEALSQEQSHYLLTINHMLPALDLHLLKTQENLSIRDIFPIYVQVGELLKIKELELAIENLDVQSAWDALARHNLKDDLEFYQLQITKKIITTFKQDAFAYWKKSEQLLLKDWEHKGAELQTLEEKNFVQLSVHIRMLDRFIA